VEETFKTGKDTLGWDQTRARTFGALCRHTVLTAFAQLRTIAVRAGLASAITLPEAPATTGSTAPAARESTETAAGLQFHVGGAPLPVTAGQPCPPGITPIELPATETARIERLARAWKDGILDTARLAFHLRWSAWRRRHQARARWHHYSARLAGLAA
jgi:hypothetical protein